MSTTIDVICYKSKMLKNNENPLMLRVTKDRKRRYLSLGISINPQYWDFTKNKPKRNCPNKEQILKLIAEKTKAYREQIIELKATDKDFTAKSLIEKVHKPTKAKTVKKVFDEQIERLFAEKRRGYALSHKQVLNSLIEYNKHLDIYFSDIDVTWLRKYETWLRSNNISTNTIGIRFRTLRAVFNIAIKEKIVKAEYYPFNDYNVSKLKQETVKRSISKDDILSVINYSCNNGNSYTDLAIDLFTFSYVMAGINFVDMAYLTKDNIIDGRLIYFRKKTNKLIKTPLQDKAIDIISKYQDNRNPYLFPILNSFHKTEQQKANRVHKVITKVNKRLKQIGQELDIPIDLTTYVARHSFATVLKRSGVNTSIISESLGHSSEKVTQIYLDSFENSQIDEAMKNLL
ncbi:site-specific integrase [Dysgonomonas sp. 520]|uniref:site-specific integrase n=1 Tax=Dysgonomonas sp. 520 TaxID=2302931 RepID=UPI0013D4F1A4|nr:site-specific integrase [Dysgonomonas sp. 520]NDW11182.1 site-specific integrase [Dysgonomonas sp. 520]